MEKEVFERQLVLTVYANSDREILETLKHLSETIDIEVPNDEIMSFGDGAGGAKYDLLIRNHWGSFESVVSLLKGEK